MRLLGRNAIVFFATVSALLGAKTTIARGTTRRASSCVGLTTVVEPSTTEQIVRANGKTEDNSTTIGPGDLLLWGDNLVCDVPPSSEEPGSSEKAAASVCTNETSIGTSEGQCLGLPNGNMDCVITLTFSDGILIFRGIDESQNGAIEDTVYDVIVGGTGCYKGAYGVSGFNWYEGEDGIGLFTYHLGDVHLPLEARRLRQRNQ